MLTEPRAPSLTIEVSFTGETAECVIFGSLDPASTPVLSDMLTLVLAKHPRKLVLRTSGSDSTDCAAQMIADAIKLLPAAARPMILRRSLPGRRRLRRTGSHAFLPVQSPDAFRGDAAGRDRRVRYRPDFSRQKGSG